MELPQKIALEKIEISFFLSMYSLKLNSVIYVILGFQNLLQLLVKLQRKLAPPPYMSPEMHDGQEYDFKADIWYAIYLTYIVAKNDTRILVFNGSYF